MWNVANMPDSGLPRRRSPRHSGGAPPGDNLTENVLPSPAAATPSKPPLSTPSADAVKENGNGAGGATPSSILKRRRRSILSEVSKVDGKPSPAGVGLNAAQRKKRKQSLASRRVSFAVESALESVREFQKDERDADKAFPDPIASANAVSAVLPKPPVAASIVTCPPPSAAGVAPASPFGSGPASAAAEAVMAAFSPAATPETKTGLVDGAGVMATPSSHRGPVDPFAAFGVSDSPVVGAGSDVGDGTGDGMTLALGTPGSGVTVQGLARVSNASDFIPLGTPVSVAPSSVAPSSAGGQSVVSDVNEQATPGSMFKNHLPRRVTMDPGQYRDAMKAAADELPEESTDVIHEEEETEEDAVMFTEHAMDNGITAAVPGLSALVDEDEDDFGEEPGEHTMNMLNGLKESVAGEEQGDVAQQGEPVNYDITSAVPGLSSLADDDEDAGDAFTTEETMSQPSPKASISEMSFASSAEKSPAMEGLPMGSITEDVAAAMAAELAAAVAKDNLKPRPETTEEFAFSAALVAADGDDEKQPKDSRKSLAKKRRMTLGVRHDVESPAPADSPEAPVDAAHDLNLSDSYEVPPGAEDAAASVHTVGITTLSTGGWTTNTEKHTGDAMDTVDAIDAMDAATDANTGTTAAPPSSDAFSEPGTDTLNILSKMKDDDTEITTGGYLVSVSDPVGTAGGDTTKTGGFTLDTNPVTATITGLSEFKNMAPLETPSTNANGTGSASPYSSEGTVTPANPTPASDAGSDGDGFTPGPDTLLMMEKLKGRVHGDANLESVKRGNLLGRPSLSAHNWVAPTPLPPIGGAMSTTFTPNKTGTIAGGFGSAVRGASIFGGVSNQKPLGAQRAFGGDTTGLSPFAPGASQRLALRSAKKQNDAMALGLLGLPLEVPPVPQSLLGDDSQKVPLADFFHACEVSFMDAKNLRRKSVAMTSLCTATAPTTITDALKLICLTAPMIEAMDPMHDHLNDSLSSLAQDAERLRFKVEDAQPPLLRLAASSDSAHIVALKEAGKMLKKQCQLLTKEDHAARRLQTERNVAHSLSAAKMALQRVQRSLVQSKEIAKEVSHCADVREVDLKRRLVLTGDQESRDLQRLKTREGALIALAERRSRVQKLRQQLTSKNSEIENETKSQGALEASIERAESTLLEAKAVTEAKGDSDVLADGGAARRAASAKRVKQLAANAKKSADELRVLNSITPWRLEKIAANSSGAELVVKVGKLFRVAVDLGTGAGRVTLCTPEGPVTPAGGAAFVAAIAGVPKAWSETCVDARDGDVASVLQHLVPTLMRAESVLEEAEQCRAAFPRITRVRCTAGGDLELTFVDFTSQRKVLVTMTMANGAYPKGALRPRVFIKHAGVSKNNSTAPLPDASTLEAAIERVPAGEASRRLFGVCRLVDWIVARGEVGMGDAAREAAAAARAPPPAPAPAVFPGVVNNTLPFVARKGDAGDDTGDELLANGAVAMETSVAPVETTEGMNFEMAPEMPTVDRLETQSVSGSGRPSEVTTTTTSSEPTTLLSGASPSMSVPLTTPASSDWGEEYTENVPPVENVERETLNTGVSPIAKTPAGFQKGSNPLFDDSDDEMDLGEDEGGN